MVHLSVHGTWQKLLFVYGIQRNASRNCQFYRTALYYFDRIYTLYTQRAQKVFVRSMKNCLYFKLLRLAQEDRWIRFYVISKNVLIKFTMISTLQQSPENLLSTKLLFFHKITRVQSVDNFFIERTNTFNTHWIKRVRSADNFSRNVRILSTPTVCESFRPKFNFCAL